MKRLTLKTLLVVTGVAGLAAVVSAALIGVPVGLDAPLVNFQNLNDGLSAATSPAAVVFDGTNLTVDTTPNNIDFGGGPQLFDAPPPTVHIQMKVTSTNGSTYTGTAGDDFVMTGKVGIYDGVLLKGKLIQFGFLNRNGSPSSAPDAMDFRFRVTDGLLASQFAGKDLGVTLIMEADNWLDGNAFGVPFQGNAKGQLSPIPACTGSIGDYVWLDSNSNGIQDDGPGGSVAGAGLAGAVVTLTDSVGNLIPVIGGPNPYTTGGDGAYLFSNLCGGTYKVTTQLPGYTPTTPNSQGSTTANDSNPNPYLFTLPNDTSDLTIDFGYVPQQQTCQVKIGDYVWYDLDLDGIQDANESGLDGWTVNLMNGNTLVATTTTGVNPNDNTKHGYYSFTVPCGTYTVQLVMQNGYALTLTTVGADRTVDSNPNPSGTTPAALTNGQQDLTVDFGVVNEQDYCPPSGTNTANSKAGKLYWTVAANGDVTFRFDQDNGLNDNSYGANQVGWGANSISGKSHKFSDLVGSDKAEFIFTNAGGTKVLDFYEDYISLKSGTPSGYGNQGITTCQGCDGSLVSGTASWVLSTNSSLAHNLNDTGYCSGGACTVSGTNLLVDSPPTTSSTSYNLVSPATFAKWNFTDSFEGKISGAAFGGSAAGFGTIAVGLIHNSPSKASTDAITPQICNPGGGGGGDNNTCPAGTTESSTAGGNFLVEVLANGDVHVKFDQSKTAANDNSYGTGSIGWGGTGHKFSDLTGSDKAQFALYDKAGTKVLDFALDYLSAKTGTPSGYGSLGPDGGDGALTTGTRSWIKSFDTSMDRNLNDHGFCSAPNSCTFSGTNLLSNSPAADSNYNVSNPAFAAWEFTNSYEFVIDAAAFANGGGFSYLNIVTVHNSPSKGTSVTNFQPCSAIGGTGGGGTGSCGVTETAKTASAKEVQITLHNGASANAILSALSLTWPTTNGKLMQVKLDGDIIYDSPDIPAPSANLTTAQLVADQTKRTIAATGPKSTRVLHLVFEKNADTNMAHYTGTVSFASCVVTILP